MKTFKHNGKQGDIIFSLPTIRELGGGILYIPQNTPDACKGMFDNMRELLLMQPYIHEVREYPSGLGYGQKAPGIHIDVDLDDARNQPNKGVTHIVKRYLDQFGVKLDNWKEPWLAVPWSLIATSYAVVNYTRRHILNEQTNQRSTVNWKRVHESIAVDKFFVGTIDEYNWYTEHIGDIIYFPCSDTLVLAMLIAGAKEIYCNQSCVLALAQALGKEYYLDVKPGKTNCLLYTKTEHLL